MLTEEQLYKIIEENPKVAVMLWDDNCPFCTEFKPIFAEAGIEGITYVTFKAPRNEDLPLRDKYKIDKSVPKTLLFENGELKSVGKGRMFLPQLQEFLKTGVQQNSTPNPVEFAKNATLPNLEASLFKAYQDKMKAEYVHAVFQAEWNKRLAATGINPFEV